MQTTDKVVPYTLTGLSPIVMAIPDVGLSTGVVASVIVMVMVAASFWSLAYWRSRWVLLREIVMPAVSALVASSSPAKLKRPAREKYRLVPIMGKTLDLEKFVHALDEIGGCAPTGVCLSIEIKRRVYIAISGRRIEPLVEALKGQFPNELRVEPERMSKDYLWARSIKNSFGGVFARCYDLGLSAKNAPHSIADGDSSPPFGDIESICNLVDAEKKEWAVIQVHLVPSSRGSVRRLELDERKLRSYDPRALGSRPPLLAIAVAVGRLLPLGLQVLIGRIDSRYVGDGSSTDHSRRVGRRIDEAGRYNYRFAVAARLTPEKRAKLEKKMRGYLSRLSHQRKVRGIRVPWLLHRMARNLLVLPPRPGAALPVITSSELAASALCPYDKDAPITRKATSSALTLKATNLPRDGLVIAHTNHEATREQQAIRVSRSQITSHGRFGGGTGTGKTSVLIRLAIAAMTTPGRAGPMGFLAVDPKRSLVGPLLSSIPEDREEDVIVIDPGDEHSVPGLNLAQCPRWLEPANHAQIVVNALRIRFGASWGHRLNEILTNGLLALVWANLLLEESGQPPRYTIYHLLKHSFLAPGDRGSAPPCRREVLNHLEGDGRCFDVLQFWESFERNSAAEQQSQLGSTTNKIAALDNPAVRQIFGKCSSDLDVLDWLDSGKIVLLDLGKADFTGESGKLCGTLLINLVLQAAIFRYSRASRAGTEDKLREFMILVDEVQNFTSPEFAEILNEGRAYAAPLWVAHQTRAQIKDHELAQAFDNAATQVYFRQVPEDASHTAKYLGEPFNPEVLNKMPKFNFVMRSGSDVITGRTLRPSSSDEAGATNKAARIRKLSELKYVSKRNRTRVSGEPEAASSSVGGAPESSPAGEDRRDAPDRRPAGLRRPPLKDLPENLEDDV